MKKLFSLLVVMSFSLVSFYAQAQSCMLMRDSVIAGQRPSSYTDYIYSGSLLAQVSHVDSGQISPHESQVILYTGTNITEIRTISHFPADTLRQVIKYTYTSNRISRLEVVENPGRPDSAVMAHNVSYDGSGNIQHVLLDGAATVGSPKGPPLSFVDLTWSNGNLTSLNLLLGTDTIELTVTTDDKKNIFKHLINRDGAPFLFQAAGASNITDVVLVNSEVIDGNTIPAGTPVIDNSFTYYPNDEVETLAEGQSLFSDNPRSRQFIFECDSTSGILSPAAATAISIYPNPTSEFISLENATFNGVVNIFDAAGKTVMSRNMTGAVNSLDVRSLQPGIYFVEMTDNNKVFRGRFQKN